MERVETGRWVHLIFAVDDNVVVSHREKERGKEKKKEERKDTGISVDINRNVQEKLFNGLGKKKKAQEKH